MKKIKILFLSILFLNVFLNISCASFYKKIQERNPATEESCSAEINTFFNSMGKLVYVRYSA